MIVFFAMVKRSVTVGCVWLHLEIHVLMELPVTKHAMKLPRTALHKTILVVLMVTFVMARKCVFRELVVHQNHLARIIPIPVTLVKKH
jgi:hypothetical protein